MQEKSPFKTRCTSNNSINTIMVRNSIDEKGYKKSPTAKKNNLFDGAFGEKQKDDPV